MTTKETEEQTRRVLRWWQVIKKMQKKNP